MTYTINFDAGADGANITAGGAITAVTGTPKYENSPSAHGGMGMFASSGTTTQCIRCTTSPTTHSGSVYLRVPVVPDTHIRMISFRNNAASTVVCNIRLKSDRTLTLADGSTVDKAIGATVIPLNQWVRIDWQYDNSNTAAPILTTRLFLNAEGTAHDEQLTWTFTGTVNVFESVDFGVVGSASVTNRQVLMDTIRVVDGLSWAAPFAPPVIADENIIYGPVDPNQSGRTLAIQAKGRAPKDLMTNDYLLATLQISATQSSVTLPSGWSLLVPQQNPSGACTIYAYRKAPGTVGLVSTIADTEFTFSWITPGKASLTILPIGGIDDAAPFSDATVSVKSVSSVTHDCPSFTAAISGRRLNIITMRASTIQVGTKPTGDTLRGEVHGLKGSGNYIGISDSTTNVATGGQGTKQWTTDLAAGSGTMLSVILKPQAAAIGTRKFQGATRFMIAQAITSSSFKVYGKTIGATSIRLAYSVNSDMSSPSFIAAQAPDSRGYVRFSVPSLSPGVQYYYQFMDTPTGLSERAISDIGKLRTLKQSGSQQSFNFAFGGCQLDESPISAALDNIRNWNPEFLAHLGDFHYQNPGESASAGTTVLHERYFEGQIENAAGLKTLLRNINFFYGRSDHEAVEADNGDTNIPMNAEGISAMKNIFPMTIADTRNPTIGTYQSWVVGRVRFIHIDIRNSDRSSGDLPQGTSKTMLGATQKQWLKDRLMDPEPVKVILSDEGWNHAPDTTGDKVAWWAYNDEQIEIANFIETNGVRVYFCASNDHKMHATSAVNNMYGDFPIVGAAPFDNIGGGLSVADTEYSSGAARGSQYGRVEVVDTGSQIQFTFRGWDALTDTQKILLVHTFDVEAPDVLTGAGNETNGGLASSQTVSAVRPANSLNDEYMLAQVFHRTAASNGFTTQPDGWVRVGPLVNTTYTMATYLKKVDAGDTVGKSYTWGITAAAGRTVVRINRVVGAHLSAPIDTEGDEALHSGTTSLVLPGIDPETTSSLLVAVMGAGRSSLTPVGFSAPSGMTLQGTTNIDDGASSSSISIAKQVLGNDTPTGDKAAALSPSAVNSVGYLLAFRALNAPVAPSIEAIMSGGVTPTSAQVGYRVLNAVSSVRLAVSTSAGMTSPVFSSPSSPTVDGFGKCDISGLAADTQYWYRLEVDGVILTTHTGKFRTFPTSANFNFLAASCAVTGSNDPIFTNMKDRVGTDGERALFFAHLGDWDYTWGNGGITPVDEAQVTAARMIAFDAPLQAALYAETPLDYGWSDVDFCGSGSDGSFAAKALMQSVFRKIWPSHPLPSTEGGIQRAYTVGRVRFIHTDGRSLSTIKSATDNSSKTLLGAEQKAWFKDELLQAKTDGKLVIWFHDNNWDGSPAVGLDNWQGYSTERNELATFIDSNNIPLYYIHGDTHTLVADDGTNNPFGGFPFVCVAPMHQQANAFPRTVSNGSYPVGTVTTAHQYGWFEVTDDGETITVLFKGLDGDGTERITMTTAFIPAGTPSPVIRVFNGVTEGPPVTIDGVWTGSTIVPAQLSLSS